VNDRARAVALDQLRAEPFLGLGELPADRGLAEADPLAGTGDGAGDGDGMEDFESAKPDVDAVPCHRVDAYVRDVCAFGAGNPENRFGQGKTLNMPGDCGSCARAGKARTGRLATAAPGSTPVPM
jgi:hypothetical protein